MIKIGIREGLKFLAKIVKCEKTKKEFAIWFAETGDSEIKQFIKKCNPTESMTLIKILTGGNYRRYGEISSEIAQEEMEEREAQKRN